MMHICDEEAAILEKHYRRTEFLQAQASEARQRIEQLERERNIDARAAAKVLADLEAAKARERRHRMAIELRENMSRKELSLPFEKSGYAFDSDDPRVVCCCGVTCLA